MTKQGNNCFVIFYYKKSKIKKEQYFVKEEKHWILKGLELSLVKKEKN